MTTPLAFRTLLAESCIATAAPSTISRITAPPGRKLAIPAIADNAKAPPNHQQSASGTALMHRIAPHIANPPTTQHGRNPTPPNPTLPGPTQSSTAPSPFLIPPPPQP